jgi:hypothetical protein
MANPEHFEFIKKGTAAWTHFGDVDLSVTQDLNTAKHYQ